MSLTVALRTPAGADTAVVTAVGQTVALDVVATVTASDGTTADDGLQDVEGSFLSAAVGTTAIGGNLAATPATEFDALGAAAGTAQDLNGDGYLDVGSNVTDSSAVGDYFLARADAVQTDGTVTGAAESFTIATVTYTVTTLSGSGQTTVAFRPRDTSALPGTFASHWTENADAGGSNEKNGTFAAGTPFELDTATGSVTATAYDDANGNGQQDAGEAPLAGTTVYADVNAGAGPSGNPSAVTGADGTATIAGVPAGTYAVEQVAPTGYAVESAAGQASHTVTVTAGQQTAAGAYGAEPDGSVAGTAYVDANGDGTRQASETAAPPTGMVVSLVDAAGTTTTATAADGSFAFADVVPGTYTLSLAVPAGYAATSPAGGAESVTVAPGGAVTGQLFGVVAAPTTGAVTGTVFADGNGDGTEDGTDAGLSGVTVYVDANGNGADDDGLSAVTAADGTYTIADVPAGSAVVVRDVLPTGATQSVPTAASYTVAVTAGAAAAVGPFGVYAPPGPITGTPVTVPAATTGTITGTADLDTGGTDAPRPGATLYLDANGNGRLDAGEVTATAAADGTYSFDGLTPGTYTVRQLLPLGDVSTAPAAGVATVAVSAGGTAAGIDFAAEPLGASPLTAAVLTAPVASAIGGVTKSTVKVRLTDGGTAAFAGPVAVAVYASADGTVTTQDAAAATVTRTLRLRPGKAAVVAVPVTFPATLASGSYQLVAAASTSATDAPAQATATGTVAVVAPTADLSPTIVAPAAGLTVRPGDPAAAVVRVTNSGDTTAVGTVSVVLFTSGGTAPIGSVDARRVKVRPGGSVLVRVPFKAPTEPVGYAVDAVITPTTSPADDDAADDTSASVTTR